MSRPRRHRSLICGGSDTGSTSPNRPSRAHTRPTPPRRNRWNSVEITEHADSQPQPKNQFDHSTGQRTEAHTSELHRRSPVRGRCQRCRSRRVIATEASCCRGVILYVPDNKEAFENKEVRRSSFQPNEDRAQSGTTARAIRRNSMPSRLDKRRQFHKSRLLVCRRRAACGYGRDRDLAAVKSITLPGSDEFLGWSEWNSGVSDLGGSGSLGRPRTNRPTLALHSLDWAPGPKL